MNIRKKILTRCGALLTAVLVLAPTALAAEAEIPYIPQTVPAAQLAPADQRGQEDWQLLLVNPWHTVPEGYEIKLATLSNGLQVDERWRRRPPGGWPSPAPASTRPAWLWTL